MGLALKKEKVKQKTRQEKIILISPSICDGYMASTADSPLNFCVQNIETKGIIEQKSRHTWLPMSVVVGWGTR